MTNVELDQRDLIDGVRHAAARQAGIELRNPSTGEVLCEAAQSDPADVAAAISAAARVADTGSWASTSIDERAEFLLAIADALQARATGIGAAEALGSGVPISVAEAFGGATADVFRGAVELMRTEAFVRDVGESGRPVQILRLPWGPTAILVPWNAAAAMAAKKVSFALANGAPVILKPPERSPFGCNIVVDAIEEANLPPGVFQLVHGGPSVGRAITEDPRIRAISFTGAVTTGRDIARAGAGNMAALQLELGGNNPVIVLADADVEATAEQLSLGMVKLNGQWCEGPGKIFVPRGMHDALVTNLLQRLAQVSVGSHDDATVGMGPLANVDHRARLQSYVDALVSQGGTVHCSHEVPATGAFWSPRVITGVPQERAVEEMFGPAVTVHPYDDIDDAVGSANASPYGLAGYVFGDNLEAAMDVGRRIRFGEVKVNGTSLLDLSPESVQSFWRASGIGGHGDREVFRFFSGSQIVGVDRKGLPI